MMTQEVCLDANIFVSALIPTESLHKEALSIIRTVEIRKVDLFEPALILFEVQSALHRKQLEGILSSREASEALDHFLQFPLLLLWQPPILKLSTRLVSELSFRKTYDAAYLAVAISRHIPLVTFDEELIRKGKKYSSLVQSGQEFVI